MAGCSFIRGAAVAQLWTALEAFLGTAAAFHTRARCFGGPTRPPACPPASPSAPAVSERHLVRVVAQLERPLGLVMEFAEGQPMAAKPNLEVSR